MYTITDIAPTDAEFIALIAALDAWQETSTRRRATTCWTLASCRRRRSSPWRSAARRARPLAAGLLSSVRKALAR